MGKTILTVLATLLFIFLLGAGGLYLFSKFNNTNIKLTIETAPTLIPQQSITPQIYTPAPIETPTNTIPNGWLTYKNSKYGFSISYPPSYKALDDTNNLYGWKNGIVLLYKGGQSYDLAIQAWDLESEYKLEYPNTPLTVNKIGDKFITLLNNNSNPEIDSIIATFSKL